MPPVAAAVLPHPPLLVRELAGAAAPELDPLRTCCLAALQAVLTGSEVAVVVGHGPTWGIPEPTASGSFRPYGLDLEVTLPPLSDLGLRATAEAFRPGDGLPGSPEAADHDPDQAIPAADRRLDRVAGAEGGFPEPARLTTLPLSLAVAAYLLARLPVLPPIPLVAVTVPPSLGPGAAAAVGRLLASEAELAADPARSGDPSAARSGGGGRVGLVVLGDLSVCRTERAPGGFRPEAAAFDGSVVESVRGGRLAELLDLDPAEADALGVTGRVPLQVMAGALERGPALAGRVLYDDAPYGVGYLVAVLAGP